MYLAMRGGGHHNVPFCGINGFSTRTVLYHVKMHGFRDLALLFLFTRTFLFSNLQTVAPPLLVECIILVDPVNIRTINQIYGLLTLKNPVILSCSTKLLNLSTKLYY